MAPTLTRPFVLRALGRGWRRRCPHCGVGAMFAGWSHLERCASCGLVFEPNRGDTWAFTIILDRLPLGALIVLLYFGVIRSHRALGIAIFAGVLLLFIWSSPRRWGVGIALHYVSRIYWPDPADPLPNDGG